MPFPISVPAFGVTLRDEVGGEASEVAAGTVGEAVLALSIRHGAHLAPEVAVL